MQQYNKNNPSIKRILQEVKEMQKSPSPDWTASPLEDNLFEWHFTIRGPPGTSFEGGIYHGRILLPADYPFKPPNIILLTPNGRFEVGTKICLTISAHHPEFWQPSWSIRTVLVALIGFMPTKGEGAIGALDYTPEERQQLAKKSVSYACPRCGICNATALPSPSECPSTPIEEDLPPFIFAGEATSSNNNNNNNNRSSSSSSSSTSGGGGSGQTTESGKRSADASLQQQKEKEKEKDDEAATKEEEAERGATVATVENDRQEQQLPQSPQLQQRHQQEVLRQQLQPQVAAAAAIAPNAIVVTESALRRLDYVIVALLFVITALFWKKYLV